jgi:hypothetical protein
MLYNRQKRFLALLDAHGGEMGNVDFPKLLFFYRQESEASLPYEFVP